MDTLPSIKTHPVLMSLITVIVAVLLFIAGLVGGWTLRTMAESRAELAVVVDDGEFMQRLEVRVQQWEEAYNKFDEDFHNDNQEIPDCIAKPMPSFYHDNDYSLQPDREYEE